MRALDSSVNPTESPATVVAATPEASPPALGRDTRAVLDRLGVDPVLQQQLLDAGVLKVAPDPT